MQSRAALELQLHRKKTSNKRRRSKAGNNKQQQQQLLPHELVEIWDGAEDVPSSEDGDADNDGELLADSDECSDGAGHQLVPAAVLKHLHGEGPYIRAIAETNISELLSGAENDGSYSSPMSNKSEKNLADFDDEDVSPCEEELAQLVNSHAGRVPAANCRDVAPAFAAAAAALMAAQSAMAMQKSGETNVAAAAAAVAAAAVATGNAQQSLVAMRQQANAAAAVAAAAAAKAKSDSDGDLLEVSNKQNSPKSTSTSSSNNQPSFKLNDVCQPGNTLLWDLLQDDKIVSAAKDLFFYPT